MKSCLSFLIVGSCLFSEKQLATLKTELKSSRRDAFARNTTD